MYSGVILKYNDKCLLCKRNGEDSHPNQWFIPTGKIEKGDMLVSAGNGCAMSDSFPAVGSVLGKSLENFDGEYGIIEVAVGRL